jgi:ABC-type antimicrobial peptide transport system permease subunit
MAVGASRRDILRLITGYGARRVGVGLAIGLLLAIGAARALESLLVGVTPFDPLTYGAVAGGVAVIAAAACAIPARRAARIDPMAALRS